MATSKKTETSKATETSTAVAAFVGGDNLPAYMKQGQGRGSENVGTNDMLIPRLEIIQSLSPIKETITDARDGDLFNSVTQEVYGQSVYFVPIYYRMEFLIWKDQDEGGGFFGSFPTLEQAQKRLADAVNEGENENHLEIVDTPVHFGLLVSETGAFSQIVLSMAKTKARVSRRWNSMIQIAGGDRFSRVYKVGSFTDENKKGQKFKNFVVQPAGFTPEAVYAEAERQYAALSSGMIKANHASAAPSDGVDTSDGRGDI